MSRREYDKVQEVPGLGGASDGLFGPYKFITLSSGRKLTFSDAMSEAESAQTAFVRGISRGFKLMATEWDLDRLEERLRRMEEYVAACRHFLREREAEKDMHERIAALRNVEGRTPEEAAAYLRKADELERKLPAR